MIRKLTLAIGFGAGYVLGAKAGTQRYDEIMSKARELMGQPAVQDLTNNLSSTASSAADKAKSTLNDTATTVSDKAKSASDKGGSSSSTDTVVDLGTTTLEHDVDDLRGAEDARHDPGRAARRQDAGHDARRAQHRHHRHGQHDRPPSRCRPERHRAGRALAASTTPLRTP